MPLISSLVSTNLKGSLKKSLYPPSYMYVRHNLHQNDVGRLMEEEEERSVKSKHIDQ